MNLNSNDYIKIAKAWVKGFSVDSLTISFGLPKNAVERAISEIFIPKNTPGFLSTSVRAKNQGLKAGELFIWLHKEGMLEQFEDKKHFLTTKGFENGGRFTADEPSSLSFWPVWSDRFPPAVIKKANYNEVLERLTEWILKEQRGNPPKVAQLFSVRVMMMDIFQVQGWQKT
jgi:hypothetical protein